MDVIENIDRHAKTEPFVFSSERHHAKKHIFPFSLCQVGLFLSDVFLAFACFAAVELVIHPAAEITTWKTLTNSLVWALVCISFFAPYRLYSYHLIYDKKAHVVALVKSFCWAFFIFGVIWLVYRWSGIFEEQISFVGPVILLCAVGLVLMARFISNHIANFVMAAGISFVAVGLNGLILQDRVPPLIQDYGAAIPAIFTAALAIYGARLFLVNVVFSQWLKRYFRRQILIVGTDSEAGGIAQYVMTKNAPFWIAGYLTIKHGDSKEWGMRCPSKKCLGTIRDLPEVIDSHGIHEIIVTDKTLEKALLVSLLDYCLSRGIVVWFPPPLLPIIQLKLYIDRFCTLPMIRLCVQRTPALFSGVKRVMDLVLTIPLLVLLLPLFFLVGIAVKFESDGPVFYKGLAVGRGGKTFKMFKFRSMRTGSSHRIHKEFVTKLIRAQVPSQAKEKGVLKITDDPRVTRVGRVLRKFSMDELPQLINVLMGDMSLVGPRPCLPYEYEMYKSWYKKRGSVLPGITGLWQVTGRSEVEFEDMILLDLYYIYNRNLLLDLAILFETIFVVFSQKGAW